MADILLRISADKLARLVPAASDGFAQDDGEEPEVFVKRWLRDVCTRKVHGHERKVAGDAVSPDGDIVT